MASRKESDSTDYAKLVPSSIQLSQDQLLRLGDDDVRKGLQSFLKICLQLKEALKNAQPSSKKEVEELFEKAKKAHLNFIRLIYNPTDEDFIDDRLLQPLRNNNLLIHQPSPDVRIPSSIEALIVQINQAMFDVLDLGKQKKIQLSDDQPFKEFEKQQLQAAIMANDPVRLGLIIADPTFDITMSLDSEGNNALHLAIKHNCEKAVNVLAFHPRFSELYLIENNAGKKAPDVLRNDSPEQIQIGQILQDHALREAAKKRQEKDLVLKAAPRLLTSEERTDLLQKLSTLVKQAHERLYDHLKGARSDTRDKEYKILEKMLEDQRMLHANLNADPKFMLNLEKVNKDIALVRKQINKVPVKIIEPVPDSNPDIAALLNKQVKHENNIRAKKIPTPKKPTAAPKAAQPPVPPKAPVEPTSKIAEPPKATEVKAPPATSPKVAANKKPDAFEQLKIKEKDVDAFFADKPDEPKAAAPELPLVRPPKPLVKPDSDFIVPMTGEAPPAKQKSARRTKKAKASTAKEKASTRDELALINAARAKIAKCKKLIEILEKIPLVEQPRSLSPAQQISSAKRMLDGLNKTLDDLQKEFYMYKLIQVGRDLATLAMILEKLAEFQLSEHEKKKAALPEIKELRPVDEHQKGIRTAIDTLEALEKEFQTDAIIEDELKKIDAATGTDIDDAIASIQKERELKEAGEEESSLEEEDTTSDSEEESEDEEEDEIAVSPGKTAPPKKPAVAAGKPAAPSAAPSIPYNVTEKNFKYFDQRINYLKNYSPIAASSLEEKRKIPDQIGICKNIKIGLEEFELNNPHSPLLPRVKELCQILDNVVQTLENATHTELFDLSKESVTVHGQGTQLQQDIMDKVEAYLGLPPGTMADPTKQPAHGALKASPSKTDLPSVKVSAATDLSKSADIAHHIVGGGHAASVTRVRENGSYAVDLYYRDIDKSRKGISLRPNDDTIRMAIEVVEKWRAKNPNPGAVMEFSGDIPKQHLRAMMYYCEHRGYECVNNSKHKDVKADNRGVEEFQDRIKKHPELAGGNQALLVSAKEQDKFISKTKP